MICPTCGGQIADNSTFCMHCGSSVPTQNQPVVQQPVMQEPVAQTAVMQEPASAYQQNNNFDAGYIFNAVKQYIDIASSVLVPSIVGLALSWTIPFIGNIIGLIMSGNVNSKIALLPIIDETVIDPSILGDYQSARRKVKTASILAKIGKIYSIVMLILWIGLIAFYILYFVFVFFLIGNM